jgi:hypothetical protein
MSNLAKALVATIWQSLRSDSKKDSACKLHWPACLGDAACKLSLIYCQNKCFDPMALHFLRQGGCGGGLWAAALHSRTEEGWRRQSRSVPACTQKQLVKLLSLEHNFKKRRVVWQEAFLMREGARRQCPHALAKGVQRRNIRRELQ